MAVPFLVFGVDAGRLDRELDAARIEVAEVGDDGAVELGELSADPRHQMPDLEADVRVAGVECNEPPDQQSHPMIVG